MKTLAHFFTSSVGRKFLMAGSGGLLFLFVVGHLLGNLQIFLPPENINAYAKYLQTHPALLWPVRLALLALLGIHVWAAATLTRENRAARPVGYWGRPAPYGATLSSRTMMVSGLALGAFVIYHLLHYTVVVEGISGAQVSLRALKAQHDVYAMMVAGFSVWYVSLFYILGVGALCMHLGHGLGAMFQSLGWKNATYGPCLDRAARVVALLIFLGYASIPVAVLCGHGQNYLQQVVQRVGAASVPAPSK
ncbi:succinate dehydrogenase cytochrome b subunit [Limisphaera sp. VF-2]|jgi:succinate dehydrogenase / fumarate reductase cytochrome b subunit|uniref:succinate dehydrogenase cytochrome b subunit n=1 Tax=Limisphaera sp. VF-2 TaxID=3400418 RepID=UPI001758D33D